MHNVKNSTKNLSALVIMLQNEYKFTAEENEPIEISLKSLQNTLDEFEGIANIKMAKQFELDEMWLTLQKLYKSQFKRGKVTFQLVYSGIDAKTVVHIPIYIAYQVFSNLLMNALEALEESEMKEIFAEVQYADSSQTAIRVSIQDTGHGITPEVRRKIFKTRYSSHRSSGDGLLYVSSVLATYGGSIALAQQAQMPYKTSFIINIPINPSTESIQSI